MRCGHGENIQRFATMVSMLVDGPVTAAGASKNLGQSAESIRMYLHALEAAGVARISGWRRNEHGRPTAIWEFCEYGAQESEPAPQSLRKSQSKAERISA